MSPLHVGILLGGGVVLVLVFAAFVIRRAMSREEQRVLDESFQKWLRESQERGER